jgi:hypothetical protein
MTNFLEQLVAEWYETRKYFVRRNVLVGPRKNGGYEGELDVVAFNPSKKSLVHIEASMDAASWEKREARFRRKFEAGRKYIPGLFEGIKLPPPKQIALLAYGDTKVRKHIGGGDLLTMADFMAEIRADFRGRSVLKSAIPEQYTALRALQFAANHWK